MCLDIEKNQKIRVAEEDIICYKFLRLDDDNALVSPFYRFVYELDKEYSANIGVVSNYNNWINDISRTVHEGFHTLQDAEVTKEYAESRAFIYSNLHHAYVVVECVIPKGASYYDGIWDTHEGYASTRLKVTKILDTIKCVKPQQEDIDVP